VSVRDLNDDDDGERRRFRGLKPRSIEWYKFVNTHLSHSRPWFNIHINQDSAVFKDTCRPTGRVIVRMLAFSSGGDRAQVVEQ